MKKMRLLRCLAMTGCMVLLLGVSVQAQILKPIKWSFTAVRKSASIYEVHMTASIEKGWTTYSQWTPEGGPEPTVVTFNKNANVLLGGKVKEIGELKKKHEDTFGVNVHYFAGKVDFIQVVKLKKMMPTTLSGSITTMACDKERCLPPEEVTFTLKLK